MNEDKEASAQLDAAIERGEVCTDCGLSINIPYQESPSQCPDCYDPTPCCYQHGCGAISTNETCPERAAND